MGCWNYQIFCDDVALDVLEELYNSDEPVSDLKGYLTDLLEEEDGDYDLCQCAIVAAAVIASVVNGLNPLLLWDEPEEEETQDFSAFTDTLSRERLLALVPSAQAAVRRVLRPDSEVYQLWEETEEDFKCWKQTICSIESCLNR